MLAAPEPGGAEPAPGATPTTTPSPAPTPHSLVKDLVQTVRSNPETDRLRLRADALEKRVDLMEGWARTSAERTAFLETMASEVDGFRMARAKQIAGQQRMAEKFVASLSGLVERVDALAQDVAAMQERVEALAAGGERRSGDLADDLGAQIAAIAERQDMLQRVLSGRSRQALRAVSAAAEGAAAPAEQDHALDLLYLAFEDRARGSREQIKQRQATYLPLLDEAGAGNAERPILDLGAGRGEWLELLRDHEKQARGVDLNQAMVASCQALGLDCVEADALGTLRTLPDESIGLITGFHIIEHLPYAVFVGLLDEALRVLAPGGILLFETPDPENVIVGSHTFYMDPTHHNPMPSLMVRIVAETRGFDSVEIRRMNPSDSRFRGQDQELIAQLDALFFGPQDYAMIARKL